MALYQMVTYAAGHFYDMRDNLSWAQVGGIIGNACEGDVDEAIVFRQSDTDAERLKPIVLRYKKDGLK